jgi:hypothetical protein
VKSMWLSLETKTKLFIAIGAIGIVARVADGDLLRWCCVLFVRCLVAYIKALLARAQELKRALARQARKRLIATADTMRYLY